MGILELIEKYVKTSIETERLEKGVKKLANVPEDLQEELKQLHTEVSSLFEQIDEKVDAASVMEQLMISDVLEKKVEELYQNNDNTILEGANKKVNYYKYFVEIIRNKANQKTK